MAVVSFALCVMETGETLRLSIAAVFLCVLILLLKMWSNSASLFVVPFSFTCVFSARVERGKLTVFLDLSLALEIVSNDVA